jgi:hypothetical protein
VDVNACNVKNNTVLQIMMALSIRENKDGIHASTNPNAVILETNNRTTRHFYSMTNIK